MNEHDLAIGILKPAGIIGLCLLTAFVFACAVISGRCSRREE